MSADDMSFGGDPIANFKTLHDFAECRHYAHVFVTDHHRYWNGFGGPVIPIPDVHVGAANGGFLHCD